jgi:hypothetical protein
MKSQALALAALVALGALACSGGGRPKDAGAPADALDAAGVGDAPGPSDTSDAGDALDATPKPPPVASVDSRLVVPGDATLVGHGADSCTNAPGATGDRWCAFARPDGSVFELWVLNVTKAAMGAAIVCDGSDPSCLRLSQRLFKSRAAGYSDAGFNGDTLIYGETLDSGVSGTPFVGTLYGWRPGLPAGRALTSDVGIACVGHARSEAVLCFENRLGDGLVEDLTVDLLAGQLGSVAADGLPKMDTLVLTSTTDAPGAPLRAGFDLSPDGSTVAWSTRTKADPVETLHAAAIAGTGAPLVVARDVSRWAIAPDGAAWDWLAGYNYDVTGAPAGTLQTAPFPMGTATPLASGVGDFGDVDAGLWLRTDVAAEVGTLRWMPDRRSPDVVTTVDTKVLAVLDHAGDGASFLYAKTFVPTRPAPQATTTVTPQLVDLTVGAPGTGPGCVVSATAVALNAAFAPRGDVVVWERYDMATGTSQGLATTLSSCATATFATRLGGLVPAPEAGYLFLDDADPASGEGTLRYARVVNGGFIVADAPLQTRAAPVFAPLPGSVVAYTVATGTTADGLYVAPLPAPPPAADAGTDSTTDGGAE